MNPVEDLHAAFIENEAFLRNSQERIGDREFQRFVGGPWFSGPLRRGT